MLGVLARRHSVLVLSALLVAGCSDDGGGLTGPGDGSATPTFGAPLGGGAPTNASLDAPKWQVGQSWTWTVQKADAPEAFEATTVVLAAGADGYDVGTTDVAQAAQVYPFHLIGLGQVDNGTLAWQAHGGPVQLLRFPLKDGDAWTADFWGAPGATVTLTFGPVLSFGGGPGATVQVRYAGSDALFLAAEYSFTLGQFTRVASYFGGSWDFATATLVSTGHGTSGTPFEAFDLYRGSVSAGQPQGMAPTPLTINATANFMVMACFFDYDGGMGSYRATLSALDGSLLTCQGASAPPSGPSGSYQALSHQVPAGPAALEVTAAGVGSITAELFGVRTA
ncbi:MAG: hypothetical protein AABY18_09760 [Candidatus Thermoplasmatota archaeon]